MNKLTTALLLLLFTDIAFSQPMTQEVQFATPLSPRLANYDIAATLDAKSKTVTATETITWKNHTSDTIPDIRLHLYLNAFKNNHSTFFKESGGQLRGVQADKDGWGSIDMTEIKLVSGTASTDLKSFVEFIHPDDGNVEDQTVVRIKLPQPVLPKGEIKLAIAFTSKLPKIFARTGYAGDYVLVGQWFPKIGVYEGAGERYVPQNAKHGEWNCHQFHADTEFFADFGVYNVSITVPKNFVVGATGVQQSEKLVGDSAKTVVFHQEDVHEFAWTASPLFQTFTDSYTSKDGHTIALKLLVQPAHASPSQIRRHFDAVKNTLKHHEDWFGVYPYATVTIVDPGYGGGGSGGMEYPTFITAGFTFWGIPEGFRFAPEVVTVHEFGHQYFYGMLASNEFEEAWLDEGMNTYGEIQVLHDFYSGDATSKPYFDDKTSLLSLFGIRIGNGEFQRLGYTQPGQAKRDTIVKPAWQYARGGYGIFSYNKPATVMLTLENYLGKVTMKKVMQTYFERFKFKHPCTTDFIRVANEVSGQDLSWFFKQYLYSTVTVDYSVQSIKNDEDVAAANGLFDSAGSRINVEPKFSAADTAKKTVYDSKVVISRIEDGTMPVEVLVKFSDGTSVRETWDGLARYKVFSYKKTVKIVSAELDPDHKVLLDLNFNNNTLTTEPETAGIWRWVTKAMFWFQNALMTAMSLT
jgi:hypothetical protein